MNIYVDKRLKRGVASAPDGGVPGRSYRIGLSGPLTQLGGNVYRVNYLGTGAAAIVNVSGESYQSLYTYSLHIENIGSANKIRIRLPYDQVNADVTCRQVPDTDVSCTIPGPITARVGDSVIIPITFRNRSSTALPASTRTTGIHIGVAAAGTPSTWNSSGNGIRPPPDTQNRFRPLPNNISGVNHYPESAAGFTTIFTEYSRYYLTNSIPSGGSTSVNINVDVNALGQNLVVRILDRTRGEWLASTCTVEIEPPRITTLSCPSYPPHNTRVFNGTTAPNLNPNHGISVNTSLTTAVGPPSGYSSRGARYYQVIPGNTFLDSVVDQSTGGPRVGLTSSPSPGQQITSNRVYVDYTPYFTQAPYDFNQAQVQYHQDYRRITWTATGSAVTEIRTRVRTPGYWDNSVTPRVWVPTVYENYTYTLGYRWVQGGTSNLRTNAVGNGNIMPPCYPRTFTASRPAAGPSQVLSPDTENPNIASASFSVRVNFGVPNPPGNGFIRESSFLTTLGYNVRYYSKGYNVNPASPPISGNYDGTLNITAPNTNLSVNRDTAVNINNVPVRIPAPNANFEAGQQVCWVVTIRSSLGFLKINTDADGTNTFGSVSPYQKNLALNPVESPEFCTNFAVDSPYSRFYGGDIYAGGGFADAGGVCTTNGTPAITGRMNGTTASNFTGSGAELAAFAAGQVRDLSALSRQIIRDPTLLTFANTDNSPFIVNSGSRQFGGGFSESLCAKDYFEDKPGSLTELNDNDVDISTLNTDKYFYDPSSGTLNIHGVIPDSRRITVYVDGDVTIGSNSGSKVGFANYTWNTIDEIPSLRIIAKGNVYIDNDVTEVDGELIAQYTQTDPADPATRTGGEIFSCALVGTRLDVRSDYNALSVACRNRLSITGGLLANNIYFLRTLGSIRQGVPYESKNNTNAAESIIFDPTRWLTNGGELPPESNIQIDSYSSAAPAL